MTVEPHFALSDALFEQQFKDCTLNASCFSHEAHLRLAYIHIEAYGLDQAEINLLTQIKIYANSIGETELFHTTVTIAAVRIIHQFMQHSHALFFKDFIREFPQLKGNFKELIAKHYSFDVFASEEAKVEYVEPDLLDF